MPLLRKQPHHLRKNPDHLVDPKTVVLMFEPTGEIFTSYEDYLQAYNFYQMPQWTCQLTGRTNLTYKEALSSEHDAAETVEAMPEALKKFVASKANFSVQAISAIVDRIVDDLKERFLPGESVFLEAEGGKKFPARVSHVDNDNDPKDDALIYHLDLIGIDSKNSNIIGYARITSQPHLIARPKNALSKILIKKFLRAILYRRTALLPWQVKPEIAQQLQLSMEPPPEAAAVLLKDANSRIKSPKKSTTAKKPISLESPPAGPIYPMDDALLPIEDRVDEDVFPSDDELLSLPIHHKLALEVWIFWSTFSKQIQCTPLAWMDWLKCLEWPERKNPPLESLVTSLLLPIAKQRKTSSRTAFYDWLTPIVLLFSTISPFSNEEDSESIKVDQEEEVGEEEPIKLDVTELGEFISNKLKWPEDNWANLLSGFLADCALLNPQNAFLADLANKLMIEYKDFASFFIALPVQVKLLILKVLCQVHLLKFDTVRSMIEESLQGQDELMSSYKSLSQELTQLQMEISEHQRQIEIMRQSQEHFKTIKKEENSLRSLKQTEGKLVKKVDKLHDQVVALKRIRCEPLGIDHQNRCYWLYSEFGFPELTELYVVVVHEDKGANADDSNIPSNEDLPSLPSSSSMDDERWFRIANRTSFDQIVHKYLNEKGIREKSLKERLQSLQDRISFKDIELMDTTTNVDQMSSHTSDSEEESDNNTVNDRKRRQGRLSKLNATMKRARQIPKFMRYRNEY